MKVTDQSRRRGWLAVAKIAVCLGAFCAASAVAAPYRLVAGDRLLLRYPGLDAPLALSVNIDGDIRVQDFGAIAVAGLDLTAAEARVRRVLHGSGQFVSPKVDLAVADYAPVLVAGAVAQPGRFAFTPGLTVASAVALAGGHSDGLRSEQDSQLLIADLQGRKRGYQRAEAAYFAKIVRLEAMLAGKRDLPEREVLTSVSSFWEDEREVLQAEALRFDGLLAAWEADVAAQQAHWDVTVARLDVQKKIVTQLEASTQSARDLRKKGLGTEGRVARALIVLEDARQDLLELQSLRIVAESAMAKTRLARESYRAQRADRVTAELQAAQLALAEARENVRRVSEQLVVLTGSTDGAAQVRYRIQSLRAERGTQKEIGPDTVLLPGDTLIVQNVAPVDGFDG